MTGHVPSQPAISPCSPHMTRWDIFPLPTAQVWLCICDSFYLLEPLRLFLDLRKVHFWSGMRQHWGFSLSLQRRPLTRGSGETWSLVEGGPTAGSLCWSCLVKCSTSPWAHTRNEKCAGPRKLTVPGTQVSEVTAPRERGEGLAGASRWIL